MIAKDILRRLRERRCYYTGECSSQASPPLKRIDLDAAEKRAVISALSAPLPKAVRARQSGLRGLDRVSALCLPDACSPDQQRLEARIFRAVTTENVQNASEKLLPTMELGQPAADSIRLHLASPSSLGPLLEELLPRAADGEVWGLPGLRMTRHPRHLCLRLLGTSATVSVAAVDDSSWKQAVKHLSEVEFRSLWRQSPDKLTQDEIDFDSRYGGRFQTPPSLASSVLRRIQIFRGARWIDSWTHGPAWKIEWSGPPSLAEAADSLQDPIFGLPGSFKIATLGEGALKLVALNRFYEVRWEKKEPIELVLRSAADTASDVGAARHPIRGNTALKSTLGRSE